jgi:hypothetical protein
VNMVRSQKINWVINWVVKIVRRENWIGVGLILRKLITTYGLGTKEKTWRSRVKVFKPRLGINDLRTGWILE